MFLRAEAGEGRAGGAEEAEGAEAELGAEVAGHDVDERGVAAVGVVEDELFEAGGRDAGAEIADDGHEGGGGDRECAGEADVLVALAVADGRERVDGGVGGELCEGIARGGDC